MARRAHAVDAALIAFVFATAACGPLPDRDPVAVDCSADDAYELKYITEWDLGRNFFAAGDRTAPNLNPVDMGAAYEVVALPEAERCADPALIAADPTVAEADVTPSVTTAFVVRMKRNQDWGSIVGTYTLTNIPQGEAVDEDGVPYEGLSFWAKNIGDRGFTLALDDRTSSDLSGDCTPSRLAQPGVGGFPREGTCGNSFEALVVPSPSWQFHTIPFTHFTQQFWPNRSSEGIDPSQIYTIRIRGPKDVTFELWLDNFAWYRKRSASD